MKAPPVTHCLLVDDHAIFAEALSLLIGHRHPHVALECANTLAAACQRLARTPQPSLVLLDLNLPGRSGREVLAELKADPELRRIPVVVLSTSSAESDILACYNAHANCYVTKPVELDDFFEFARSLRDFWLKRAVLPTRLQSVLGS